MRIVIEFYRIREQDDAHAVVARETMDVMDLNAAVQMARSLARSLDMPQRPDRLKIIDDNGRTLHACDFDDVPPQDERRLS